MLFLTLIDFVSTFLASNKQIIIINAKIDCDDHVKIITLNVISKKKKKSLSFCENCIENVNKAEAILIFKTCTHTHTKSTKCSLLLSLLAPSLAIFAQV